MTRTLEIWWDGRLAGQLTQDRHGELGFAYALEWLSDETAQPLSASLLKRAPPFSRRECRPFFGGLLPEESQRDAAAQALGVSSACIAPRFSCMLFAHRERDELGARYCTGAPRPLTPSELRYSDRRLRPRRSRSNMG